MLLSPKYVRASENEFPTVNTPNSSFHVNQKVEYYSSTHKKWYETVIIRVNTNNTLDLKCRRNADPRNVRLLQGIASTGSSEHVKHVASNSVPRFEIGQKVEYYSQTMNGWVLSYVKGVNPDGSYKLNTKKAAHPSHLRPLLSVNPAPIIAPAVAPKRSVIGGPFVVMFKASIFPNRPLDLSACKSELLSNLGLNALSHNVKRMNGFTGGQNEGIWFITNQSDTKLYCLKVVKSGRKFPSLPSERENYTEILSRYPSIREDMYLTFPQKIFSFSSLYEVFVMPVARGDRMAETVSRIMSSGDMDQLREVFKSVGRQLRLFHANYGGTQHGDLQSSNIFIDLSSGVGVTLIDLGGMGLASKSDMEYFLESISLLAKTYGTEFERTATASFIEGYVN